MVYLYWLCKSRNSKAFTGLSLFSSDRFSSYSGTSESQLLEIKGWRRVYSRVERNFWKSFSDGFQESHHVNCFFFPRLWPKVGNHSKLMGRSWIWLYQQRTEGLPLTRVWCSRNKRQFCLPQPLSPILQSHYFHPLPYFIFIHCLFWKITIYLFDYLFIICGFHQIPSYRKAASLIAQALFNKLCSYHWRNMSKCGWLSHSFKSAYWFATANACFSLISNWQRLLPPNLGADMGLVTAGENRSQRRCQWCWVLPSSPCCIISFCRVFSRVKFCFLIFLCAAPDGASAASACQLIIYMLLCLLYTLP